MAVSGVSIVWPAAPRVSRYGAAGRQLRASATSHPSSGNSDVVNPRRTCCVTHVTGQKGANLTFLATVGVYGAR